MSADQLVMPVTSLMEHPFHQEPFFILMAKLENPALLVLVSKFCISFEKWIREHLRRLKESTKSILIGLDDIIFVGKF